MTDRIIPCLWYDGDGEDAATFYVSLLPDSRIDRVMRAPVDTPSGPADTVLTVEFTLAGRPATAAGSRTAGVCRGRSRPAA